MDLARRPDQERLRHVVYLTPQAQAIIDALPRVDDTFVFTNTGKGPVTVFSVAKVKVDGLMRAALGDRPLPPWVWHDLRRSAVTGMSENAVSCPMSSRRWSITSAAARVASRASITRRSMPRKGRRRWITGAATSTA